MLPASGAAPIKQRPSPCGRRGGLQTERRRSIAVLCGSLTAAVKVVRAKERGPRVQRNQGPRSLTLLLEGRGREAACFGSGQCSRAGSTGLGGRSIGLARPPAVSGRDAVRCTAGCCPVARQLREEQARLDCITRRTPLVRSPVERLADMALKLTAISTEAASR